MLLWLLDPRVHTLLKCRDCDSCRDHVNEWFVFCIINASVKADDKNLLTLRLDSCSQSYKHIAA